MPFISLNSIEVAAIEITLGRRASLVSTALWMIVDNVQFRCRGETIDQMWTCASAVVF